MTRLLILLFFLSANLKLMAQEETITIQKKQNAKISVADITRLTSSQQQWLNGNFKILGRQKKENATPLVRKRFPDISEASLELMVSLAAKLSKGDQRKNLALLDQALEQLKKQKQALLDKINEKEKELEGTEMGKKDAKEKEIIELKNKLREVEENIRNTEETRRRVGDD